MDSIVLVILSALVALGIGIVLGYQFQAKRATQTLVEAERKAAEAGVKLAEADTKSREALQSAEAQKKTLLLEGQDELRKLRNAQEADLRERRNEVQRQERRIGTREETLDRRAEGLERRERAIGSKEQEAEQRLVEVEELKKRHLKELEVVAG